MTDNNENVRGQVVAWCELTPSGKIAFFDGKPMVMVGPVGNEHHTTPLVLQSDLAAAIAKVESLRAKLADEVEATRRAQQRAEQAEWNEVAAIARAEAADRDAARYRWLRDNNGVRNHHGVEVFIDGEAHAPGHLDAQVDDAIAAQQAEGEDS